MIRRPSPEPPKKFSLPTLRQISDRVPRRVIWQGKIAPAFWTVASIVSLVVNGILVLILIVLGRQLFALKGLVQEGLIGGLYNNFVLMDRARIKTSIQVDEMIQVIDQIPVGFDLPIRQDTVVILVEDTTIPGATVFLNNSAVKTTVVLPAGTPLNIALDLSVPVNTVVPVTLNVPVSLVVPVDIPLNQTELHEPFTGLQQVVLPYQVLLESMPDGWEETPICTPSTRWLCRWIFDIK